MRDLGAALLGAGLILLPFGNALPQAGASPARPENSLNTSIPSEATG
jgi:hypothetical protein